MKKIFFKTMLLLLTAGMSVACSSDNDPLYPDEVQTPVTITAHYGSSNITGVAYADDGVNINATWQENDKLLVMYNNMVNTLTLSSGAGTPTATFKGTVKGTLKENSMLICMVKDQNNTAITLNDDGSTSYSGAIFLEQIGGALASGKPHDGRAPDYDDWSLNGDLIVNYPLLGIALEISSMGIRVDEETLARQLEIAGCTERAELPFHKALLAGELPYTIGGGIGQSRVCMYCLRKAHIGEVQASLWPAEMEKELEESGITLL